MSDLAARIGVKGACEALHLPRSWVYRARQPVQAQFKTMKYHPDYPGRFGSIDHARQWARGFFGWYNDVFYHSGLNLMTPASVHYGEAEAVQQQRQAVMLAAYAAHPARFSRSAAQVKGVPAVVWINPPPRAENPS